MAGIDSYTKLMLHGNGLDGSNSHRITFEGDAQIDTDITDPFGNNDGCLLLNGTTAANTQRDFYIYFDITENGAKMTPNYNTNLNHSWGDGKISVNNTDFKWDLDTNRSEFTSGFYRAEGPYNIIFNVDDSSTTAEYMHYSNGTHNFTFDFVNDTTFVDGPVRIIIKQIGDEAYWGNITNKTNEGRMIKTYHFYENLSWVKIVQNYTNLASDNVTRNSTLAGSLLFDAKLAYGASYSRGGNETEPGSYYWASPGGSYGTGFVNINQSGTSNFYARLGRGAYSENVSPKDT